MELSYAGFAPVELQALIDSKGRSPEEMQQFILAYLLLHFVFEQRLGDVAAPRPRDHSGHASVETHSDGTNRINGGQVQIIVISPGAGQLHIVGLVGLDDPADDVPVGCKLGLALASSS